MNSELFHLISFLGAVQGILLSLILYSKKYEEGGHQFLALYIFVYSVGLTEPYVEQHQFGTASKLLLSLIQSFNFLYGPLLYFFVRQITGSQVTKSLRTALHFVPFAAGIIFMSWMILTGRSVESELSELTMFVLFELTVAQMLMYNFRALSVLRRKENLVAGSGQLQFNDDLRWIRRFVQLITVTYIASFILTHLLIFGLQAAANFYLVVQVLIAFTIYLTSYRIIFRPQFLQLTMKVEETIEKLTSGKTKYQRSGLKDADRMQLADALAKYMEEHKPYLDNSLSLQSLSEKIGISKNHLTEVLNTQFGQSFFDFINKYRVEEVKRMLVEKEFEHLSITGIGVEAGFRSKTAFLMNFKKFTGVRPAEYKKSRIDP
jgi:AraC-like DNA-binding protein